mgnify:CR=1 FL=1
MSKFFQFPKVQKLSFTLVSTNANVDSALSPLSSKFLNICKEMAKYFATNVTQCKKKLCNNNYNRSISSFHYFLLYKRTTYFPWNMLFLCMYIILLRIEFQVNTCILYYFPLWKWSVKYNTAWAVIYVQPWFVSTPWSN